jgi:hypothetical protein
MTKGNQHKHKFDLPRCQVEEKIIDHNHDEEQWNLQFTPKNTLYLYQKQEMLKEKCI